MRELTYKNTIQGETEDSDGPDLNSPAVIAQFKQIFDEITAEPNLERLVISGNSMK